jgi:hypothetical protein
MMSDPNRLTVTTEDYPFHVVHALSVHHRDFPEIQGEGGSPEDAAALGSVVSILDIATVAPKRTAMPAGAAP